MSYSTFCNNCHSFTDTETANDTGVCIYCGSDLDDLDGYHCEKCGVEISKFDYEQTGTCLDCYQLDSYNYDDDLDDLDSDYNMPF